VVINVLEKLTVDGRILLKRISKK